MLDVSPIDRPRSLKDLAYQKIRAHLLGGQLEAEKVYSANQFAEILGVSRTPVREALLQLAAEGYLVLIEQRGFQLRRFTEDEIRELFETRRVIELYAAERVTGTLAQKELKEIAATLKEMAARAAQGDTAGFLEADRAFHMAIVRRLGNRMLESIMENIRGQMMLFAGKAVEHKGRTAEILKEHGGILEAIRGKDPGKSGKAMLHHLLTTERYVLSRA